MSRPVTLDAELCRRYESGELDSMGVAALAGCTPTTALAALRRAGVDTRARQYGRPNRGRGHHRPGPSAFGARLQALRQRAGLTQLTLAFRVGMEDTRLSALERGHCEPSWATVCLLADALQCRTDEFR